MLEEIRREGRWRCFANAHSSYGVVEHVRSLTSLNELIEQLNDLPVVLKNNHRSRVVKGELFARTANNKSIVAKQPKNKNRSGWSRILSVFRRGEARQTFLALQRFGQLGISAGEPVLVLEKRILGMIVDSWVAYEFIEGEPSGVEQLPEIIDILTLIHNAGYQHKDPTLGNFFSSADGKLFVIDCALRGGLGHFSRCRDLMMLVDNNDSVRLELVEPTLQRYQGTFGHRVYGVYRVYRQLRETLKYTVRGRKPKNR